MFDFMSPTNDGLILKNTRFIRIGFLHSSPTAIWTPPCCPPGRSVPSICHFCHFSGLLPSRHFASTARSRAAFLAPIGQLRALARFWI
jgi:hypothetical protein